MASRRSWFTGIAGSLLTLMFLPVGWFVSLLTWASTCDGDGGEPFSARASAAGRFCSSPVATPYFMVEWALPCVVMAVGTVLAVRRASPARIGISVAGGVALLVLMFSFVESLPSYCDDEEQAHARAYDCETY
jgi:hypothetical protein